MQGNKIGSNAAGNAGLGGQTCGIYAYATNATHRRGGFGAGNLISGNSSYGLFLDTSSGVVVQGNTIGPNAAGTSSLGGQFYGIYARSTTNLTIGGTASRGDLISGNSSVGVYVAGGSGIVIQGDRIGTNAAGTAALGGQSTGVTLYSMGNVTIGGTASGAGNLISGNSSYGVDAEFGSGIVIQGNWIGTNAAGTAALGGQSYGIQAYATNATIGGPGVCAGNLVSGNSYAGVYLSSSDGAVIQGNTIGPNAAGTAALVGQIYGIFTNAATNLTIGGTASGAGNLISGNSSVAVYTVGGSGIVIQGNRIGTNAAGTAGLGTQNYGVYTSSTTNVAIGGTAAGGGNLIAYNNVGVVPTGNSFGVAIRRNAIYSNTRLGIDLGDNGVTLNDLGDADTGPNYSQNYPLLSSAAMAGGTMTIAGHSTAPRIQPSLSSFSQTPSLTRRDTGRGRFTSVR